MKFSKDMLKDLVWGDAGAEYTKVQEEMVGNRRWSIDYYMVFKVESTGKYYQSIYSVGATESQDERPYEYETDMIECAEVAPRLITKTVYDKVQP